MTPNSLCFLSFCSEHAFNLVLDNSWGCLILCLSDGAFAHWKSIAEVQHNSIKLYNTEEYWQNVRFIDQTEPECAEHGAEEDAGPDDVLFLEDLVHVGLGAVPLGKPNNRRNHSQRKDADKTRWIGYNSEDAHRWNEQQKSRYSKTNQGFGVHFLIWQ